MTAVTIVSRFVFNCLFQRVRENFQKSPPLSNISAALNVLFRHYTSQTVTVLYPPPTDPLRIQYDDEVNGVFNYDFDSQCKESV